MKAAIIVCLILSMFTINWTDRWDIQHKIDLRLLFSIAALILFLVRG